MESRLTLNTKSKLLTAAVKVFGDHGYTGGSVRQIAAVAGSNIAAIKYHYSSKEELWRAVVSHLFGQLRDSILQNEADWPKMSARGRVVDATRHYIKYCARTPELQRIILFETIHNGERLKWLMDNHMRQFIERSLAWGAFAQENGVYPSKVPVMNMHFILTGAAQTIFLMAPQIEHSFGVDVFDDEQIEKHITSVLQLLLPENSDSEK
jgi:AcrR family transcriptional regulator